MSGDRRWIRTGAATIIALGLSTAGWATEKEETLPRYSLPVGRELTYLTTEDYHPTGRPQSDEEARNRVETRERLATRIEVMRLTVLRENPDGSRHVVEQIGRYQRGADGRPQGQPSRMELRQWDIFPDGRIMTYYPLGRLPLLGPLPPQTGDTSKGWTGSNTKPGESFVCIPTTPASDGGEFIFAATEQGTETRIDPWEPRKAIYHFDRIRGNIAQSTFEYGDLTDTNRLDSDRVLSPAELAKVAGDFDRYFAADEKYDQLRHQAERNRARLDALMTDARTVLATAHEQATQDVTRGQLAEMLKRHDESLVPYTRKTADQLATLLDHPAADWTSTDLNQRPVKLSDFHGKVVVMDFWYRRCGWCMYAMPQVKQLAEDFKDKPVIFLGMSTDEDEKDARLVVDVMNLTYPTIRAQGINDQYGIHGFPTLLIVDQKGIIRGYHDGYSPTLRQEVGKEIERLLRSGI